MLINYLLVKLSSEIIFDLFHVIQLVKILPNNNYIQFVVFTNSLFIDNNISLLHICYIICLINLIIKANIDRYLIKYKQVI